MSTDATLFETAELIHRPVDTRLSIQERFERFDADNKWVYGDPDPNVACRMSAYRFAVLAFMLMTAAHFTLNRALIRLLRSGRNVETYQVVSIAFQVAAIAALVLSITAVA